jgi:carbamoylphosphate synthase large subunit
VKPTVLVATTSQWYPTARLAMALAKAGFVVKAVCPSRHPMLKTKAVRERYSYHGLLPTWSFANAIKAAKPDLVIPGDDLATRHLHRLYAQESSKGNVKSAISSLIERSLGAPESFPIAHSRTAFMDIAREEGVRVPETAAVQNARQFPEWVGRFGLPAVLKANGTSGGDGVRIVRTLQEADDAFRALYAPPVLARAVKRTLFDQDSALLRRAVLRERSTLSIQSFVPGNDATSAVACWNGKVLANLYFEVVQKRYSAGPSTVVRMIENAEMIAATEKMVRRMNLSGLYGFDFMLETGTRNAYLIEINPRSTQVGHLALGAGRDIPAALCSAVSGEPVRVSSPITEKDTIALFPQEWIRDSASPYLRSAYHDVPWEEPELIRDCIGAREKQRSWLSRKDTIGALSTAEAPRA